jgi:hypothetical protein
MKFKLPPNFDVNNSQSLKTYIPSSRVSRLAAVYLTKNQLPAGVFNKKQLEKIQQLLDYATDLADDKVKPKFLDVYQDILGNDYLLGWDDSKEYNYALAVNGCVYVHNNILMEPPYVVTSYYDESSLIIVCEFLSENIDLMHVVDDCVYGIDVEKSSLYKHNFFQKLGQFVAFDNWKDWYHTSNTTTLAKTIYQEKRFDFCPILADALMDAGCEDSYILGVLKENWQELDKGMWVIDKLAGYNE